MNLPFPCAYKAQASVEGMEYDSVWTMSIDDAIDLCFSLAAIVETKEKLQSSNGLQNTKISNSQDITAGHLSKATLLWTYIMNTHTCCFVKTTLF